MRRADIARVSVVTDGADYDFTLPDQRRGVGVLWRSQIAPCRSGVATSAQRPQSLRGHLRESEATGHLSRQTSHGVTQLRSVWTTLPGLGSTVISRYVVDI